MKVNKSHTEGIVTDQDLEDAMATEGTLILTISIVVGVAVGLVGCLSSNFYFFMVCLGICEYFLFLGTGPVGIALMSCVSKELRGQANAMAIFFMHLVGDFPSPFIIGFWFDSIGMYWGMICVMA